MNLGGLRGLVDFIEEESPHSDGFPLKVALVIAAWGPIAVGVYDEQMRRAARHIKRSLDIYSQLEKGDILAVLVYGS